MTTAENKPTDAEQLTALRAAASSVAHDTKNSVGLIWMHLATLERNTLASAEPEVRESLAGLKEETRQIVKLLDALSAQARG